MAPNRLLLIRIAAEDFTKKVRDRIMGGFRSMASIGAKAGGAIAAGFGVATAAGALLYAKTAQVIDQLAKTSTRLGIATEDLQALRTAAGYAGVSIGEMDVALRMMESNISDAAKGIGTAKDALEGMGLSAEALQREGPAQALQTILDSLSKIPDASDRTAAAMDVFGRSGAQILTLTSESIRDARKEIDELGIALTKTQTKGVEDANDAWARFTSIFGGMAGQFTATMAPAVKIVSDSLVELTKKFDLKSAVISTTESIREMGGWLITKIPAGLLIILQGISMLSRSVSGIRTGWAFINELASGLTVKIAQAVLLAAELNKKFLQSQNLLGQRTEDIAAAESFIQKQKILVNELIDERNKRRDATDKTIKEYEEQQKKIEGYGETIKSLSGRFQEVGNAVSNIGTAVEENIKNKTEESVRSANSALDLHIAKLREVRKLQGSIAGQSLIFEDQNSPERVE